MSECKECAKQARLRGMSGSREAKLRAVLEEAMRAIEYYGKHTVDLAEGIDCPYANWQAGRPTADGGYEMKYADRWYLMRPADAKTPPELPMCECGLNDLLQRIEEVLK